MRCTWDGETYYIRTMFEEWGYAIICDNEELKNGFKVELDELKFDN